MKTALITGGTSGIGLETAILLSQSGYLPIIVGSSETSINKIKTELHDINYDYYAVNMMEYPGISEFYKIISQKYSSIDTLIHAAGGLVERRIIEQMDEQLYRKIMALNLDSFVYMVTNFLPMLKASTQAPSIISLTSIAGQNGGGIGAGVYAAAKGGMISITKNMAKEFAQYGIRVNTVSPGVINTPFHSNTNRDMMNNFLKNIPLDRFGTAKEVAELIVFLVSQQSTYITGQTLNINGGML